MSARDSTIWLIKIISLLVLCIASYVLLHINFSGSEKVLLTLEQRVLINELLEQDGITSDDTLRRQGDSENINKIVILIQEFLNGKLKDGMKLRANLGEFGVEKVPEVLESYEIEIESFFWLNSDWKYLEILFWTMIGVLTSLLYSGSKAIKEGTFNPLEQATHLAKIIYAPIVALVIVLGADLLISGGEMKLDGLQYGLIVMSFLLGWFSGRAVELLNRIKNLIFPFRSEVQTYTIKGLLDWSGLPAPQQAVAQAALSTAIIALTGPNDFLREVKPDAMGNFSFGMIKPGIYEISAQIPMTPAPLTGNIQIAVINEMEGVRLIVS